MIDDDLEMIPTPHLTVVLVNALRDPRCRAGTNRASGAHRRAAG